MIGGLAINCYVEPVYTFDADIVVFAAHLHSIKERRLTKRKKDELDLIRLAEGYPRLRSIMPAPLLSQLDAAQ